MFTSTEVQEEETCFLGFSPAFHICSGTGTCQTVFREWCLIGESEDSVLYLDLHLISCATMSKQFNLLVPPFPYL